jgi:hypothetical protein
MEYLEKQPEILSYQCESLKIPYTYRKRKRHYVPDFVVDNVIIEIKPTRFMLKKINLAKFAAAREYCKQNNMEFKVLTENELRLLNIL